MAAKFEEMLNIGVKSLSSVFGDGEENDISWSINSNSIAKHNQNNEILSDIWKDCNVNV
jgi:hypothetical protein